VEPRDPALIAALLLEQGNVSQRPPRRPTGFFGGHPFGNLLLDQLLKVEGQFPVQLGIQRFFHGQRPDAPPRDSD
jgi:hypothetical protein